MSVRHERVEFLDRYIRIPTVSRRVTPEMVEQVRALWRGQGLELETLPPEDGAGTPALYGEIPGPSGAPALLLYGHYDVQPTGDPALWRWQGITCDPFIPTYFRDGAPVEPGSLDAGDLDGVLVVARGGADNKGQHTANVLGALDARRAGTLHWTVKVLLDGEEEHGSPHLEAIVRRHRDRLAARLLIGSDGPKQRNQPTLTMGVRGLLGVDIVAENGQAASLHSGNYGNIVPNPLLPLARLIADIEERVHAYAESHGRFRHEAERLFAEWADRATWVPFLRPSVNVNHLMTEGASPDLMRTIIPRAAHARIDIRLTPDTPPDDVARLVDEAAADHAHTDEGISFRVTASRHAAASYTSPDQPEFEWLLRLLRGQGEGEPVVVPILGGTLPSYVFTDVLGIPAYWLPAANADNQQHDINEHYVLRHFFTQAALYERIVSSAP
jgi:acetylornithine deacetylase/succinyl-diaminopimelate desuccinylase-like protein